MSSILINNLQLKPNGHLPLAVSDQASSPPHSGQASLTPGLSRFLLLPHLVPGLMDRVESIPIPPPRTNLYIPLSRCNMCVGTEPYDAAPGGVGTGDHTPNTTPLPTYTLVEMLTYSTLTTLNSNLTHAHTLGVRDPTFTDRRGGLEPDYEQSGRQRCSGYYGEVRGFRSTTDRTLALPDAAWRTQTQPTLTLWWA